MLEKKIAKYYDPMFVNKKNNKEMHKYMPGTTNMFPICLLILQVPWIAFEIGKQSSVSGAISQNMQSQFCLSAIREQ